MNPLIIRGNYMNSSKVAEKKIDTKILKEIFTKILPIATKEDFYKTPTTESLAIFQAFTTEAKKILDARYEVFPKGKSKAYKSYIMTLVGLLDNIFYTLQEIGSISPQRAIVGDPTSEQTPIIQQMPAILKRIMYLIECPNKLPPAHEIRKNISQDEQLTPIKTKVNAILEPKFNAQRIKNSLNEVKLEWQLLIGNVEQDLMLTLQNHKLEFKKDELPKWKQKFQALLPEFKVELLPTADGHQWRLALIDIYNRRDSIQKLSENLKKTKTKCTNVISLLFGNNLSPEQLNALQQGVDQGIKECADESLIRLNQRSSGI